MDQADGARGLFEVDGGDFEFGLQHGVAFFYVGLVFVDQQDLFLRCFVETPVEK